MKEKANRPEFGTEMNLARTLGYHPKRLAFQVEQPKSLYIQDHSNVKSMWDICSTSNSTIPPNKESPSKLIFPSHLEDHMLHQDHNSSLSGEQTRLTWSINCSILFLFSVQRADTSYMKQKHCCQILESPTSFTRANCAFCSVGGLNFTHTHG